MKNVHILVPDYIHVSLYERREAIDSTVVKKKDPGSRENHVQSPAQTVTSKVIFLSLSFSTYKMHILMSFFPLMK